MCVTVYVYFSWRGGRRYRCGGWRLEGGRLVVVSAFFLRLGGLWYFGVVVVVVSADPQYSRERGWWMGLMGWKDFRVRAAGDRSIIYHGGGRYVRRSW